MLHKYEVDLPWLVRIGHVENFERLRLITSIASRRTEYAGTVEYVHMLSIGIVETHLDTLEDFERLQCRGARQS